MRNTLQLITLATELALTLADVKSFLLVDDSSDDVLIGMLISACTATVENYLNRSLLTQTWQLTIKDFDCDVIQLAKGNVQSIESITIYDLQNTPSTLDTAVYSLLHNKVVLNYGYQWPYFLRDVSAIEINFIAGYGDTANDIPDAIKLGILMYVSACYNARGLCDIPTDVTAMLKPYRLLALRGLG